MIALAMAGCGIDDEPELETGEVESESSVSQWQSRGNIPSQMSEWQVGLAAYNGRLHMVHNGNSDPHQLWESSFLNGQWSTNVLNQTNRSTGGPALVVHGNQLKMIYRGETGNQLWMSTYGNGRFNPAVKIGSTTGLTLRGEPTAAAYNGDLYIAYCTNYGIRTERFDGSAWSVGGFGTPAACDQAELAAIPDSGRLHLVYGLSNGDMYETTRAATVGWSLPLRFLYKKTLQPISIVHCNGITHMTHGGYSTPTQIWWSERINGAWGGDFQVPDYTEGGVALGCYGNPGTAQRTISVDNGLSNYLEWDEFLPR